MLALTGHASFVAAQKEFKSEPPPNPEVHHRTRPIVTRPVHHTAGGVSRPAAKQPPGEEINEEVEDAIERGNKLSDEAYSLESEVDVVPEAYEEKYKLAEPHYRRAIALAPKDPRGYYGLGNALAGQGREAEAEQAYKQALRLRPDYAEVYYGLGMLSGSPDPFEGSDQEAIDYFQKAIRLKPDFDRAYDALGTTYDIHQRYSEALAAYQDGIRHRPDSELLHRDLGDLYEKLERHVEAVEEYRQAIRLKPEDDDAYMSLGEAYEKLGRDQEAIGVYNQVIQFDLPKAADAHLSLGKLYLKMNNPEAATKEYQALREMGPDYSFFADELQEEIKKHGGKTAPPPAPEVTPSKSTPVESKPQDDNAAVGSRVTISSDEPLNNYSAYKSGDRFYIVIPNTNASAVRSNALSQGEGYSDPQIQQRGNDVVISFRLQPGADARVNQRLNVMEIIFATAQKSNR
jgi:tetratricopeptide (TPR) repeat protein